MYYIFDTTKKNKMGQILIAQYKSTAEVVAHLEVICPKITGKSRAELMADAADLGFGDDDRLGRNFATMLSEYVNFGIIRKDGHPMRCDIFQEENFGGKTEYGH